MNHETDMRPVAYAVIILGCMLSFATAVVPHYTAGHKLMFGLLLGGLVPYVVYGAFTEILKGWVLVAPGVLLLSVDAAVKIPDRVLSAADYPTAAVSYAAIWLVLIVLPLGVGIGHWIQRWQR